MSDIQNDSFFTQTKRLFCCQGKIQSVWLAVIVFFIYKIGDSLFQPSIRLDIYNIVCALIMNKTDFKECTHEKDLLDLNDPSSSTKPVVHYQQNQWSSDQEKRIQHTATKWLLAYRLILYLPTTILCLFCAKYVDKWGRVCFMVLPTIGALIAVCISAATLYPDIKISYIALGILLGSAGVFSVFGKNAFVTIACNSYIVDSSSNEERTRSLSLLQGFNYLGLFLGSLLVGVSQMTLDLKIVLIIVAAGNILNLFIQLFVIKESLPRPVTKDVEETDSTSNKSSDSILNLFRERSERKELIILLIVLLIYRLARSNEEDVLLLFVKHSPLSWKNSLYGYHLALYYGCQGLNLVIMIPVLEKYCHLSDRTLVSIGLTMKVLRFLITAVCPNTYVIFSAALLGSTAGFVVSGCRSMLSKIVDQSETGRLFSLLSFIDTLTSLLSPPIFLGLYDLTVDFYPGFALIMDSVLNFICLLLVLIATSTPKTEYEELE